MNIVIDGVFSDFLQFGTLEISTEDGLRQNNENLAQKQIGLAQRIVEESGSDKITPEQVQSVLLDPWLATTMGTPESDHLQKVVAKTFGHQYPDDLEELPVQWNFIYAVGAIYNLTQNFLEEKGFTPEETLEVYHPYLPSQANPKKWQEGDEVRIRLNPLTSWTIDKNEAATVAKFLASPGSPALVLKTFLPVRSIVSMPHTGFGVPGTNEVVGAGGEYEALVELRFE